jgi:hypothetical protein
MVETMSGGVSDLGKYITKAVDDAISAAIGGNTGIVALGDARLGSVSRRARIDLAADLEIDSLLFPPIAHLLEKLFQLKKT